MGYLQKGGHFCVKMVMLFFSQSRDDLNLSKVKTTEKVLCNVAFRNIPISRFWSLKSTRLRKKRLSEGKWPILVELIYFYCGKMAKNSRFIAMHSVEVSWFFHQSDFTWNQFWEMWKCKICPFNTFRGSEFWFVWNFALL